MQYITPEEFYGFVVKAEVAKLTEGTNGEPNAAVLEEVNTAAVSDMEGYLRGLYRLPLPEPVEPTIKTIMGELMRFYLRTRRNDQNVSDSVFKLYQITIGKLKGIQDKKIILDAPGLAGENQPISAGTVQSWTPTQKFKNHFTGFDGMSVLVIGLALCFVSCGTSKKTIQRNTTLDYDLNRQKIAEILTAGKLSEFLELDFKVVETEDSSGGKRKETTGQLRKQRTEEKQQQQTETVTEQQQQQQTVAVAEESKRVYQSPWLWVALTVAGLVILVVFFLFFKKRILKHK